MKDRKEITASGLKGASKGAAVAGAGSILSGAAMVAVPVKVLGILTVGSAATVSLPVVASVAAGGAVVGGAAAAFASYRKQSRIEEEFEALMNGDKNNRG